MKVENKGLSGLVALVTGAGGGDAGGIGAAIAKRLAHYGAAVIVNDLEEDYASRTVSLIRSMGAEAMAAIGDVSNTEQAYAMVKAAADHFGKLDILVNNAGIGGPVPAVERMPDEIWNRTLAVDLTGPFKMSRAAGLLMRDNRFGRIINIASVASQRTGYLEGAPYTVAKSGLLGLTRHFALELGDYGITVNAIMPGKTSTPHFLNHFPPEQHSTLGTENVIGRMILPEEIGEVAAFLASPGCGHLTGVAVPADGGTMILGGDLAAIRKVTNKDAG